MDAVHVKELQAQTIDHLRGWAQEGQTLVRSARALGCDNTMLAPFEGKTAPLVTPAGQTRPRVRNRAPAGGRPPTTSNGGQAVTAEKIIAALREHPGVSRKRLAQIIGCTDQTLARHMTPLEEAGQIRRDGVRNKTTWFVAEPAIALAA